MKFTNIAQVLQNMKQGPSVGMEHILQTPGICSHGREI